VDNFILGLDTKMGAEGPHFLVVSTPKNVFSCFIFAYKIGKRTDFTARSTACQEGKTLQICKVTNVWSRAIFTS
jgi:hypothetical protein